MAGHSIPYGGGSVTCHLPANLPATILEPPGAPPAPDPRAAIEAALDGVAWHDYRGARSAAIAINDKTRPVPHHQLLPPLLNRLATLGLDRGAIRFIIATGAHPPVAREDFARVVPPEVLARYPVLCHDARDETHLVHLGATSFGTPVLANRHFHQADLRIVVGNIEPHQFQGFSGGAKSAAIGLAGLDTIARNHARMTDPNALLGRFHSNPVRQEVEEIGAIIGVHLALNTILDAQKEIIHVLAGEPRAVMEQAIPLSRAACQVEAGGPFDLVIASPGGHPKDINLYQSQKALAHASLISRDGGTVILVAACPEGSGDGEYEDWMAGAGSYGEVLARFEREGFRLGPHKAVQIARDASRVRTILVSEMAPGLVQRLLLTPAPGIDAALDIALPDLLPDARVAIMPRAASTIPLVAGEPDAEACAIRETRSPSVARSRATGRAREYPSGPDTLGPKGMEP